MRIIVMPHAYVFMFLLGSWVLTALQPCAALHSLQLVECGGLCHVVNMMWLTRLPALPPTAGRHTLTACAKCTRAVYLCVCLLPSNLPWV
jgi:hypothetical protein